MWCQQRFWKQLIHICLGLGLGDYKEQKGRYLDWYLNIYHLQRMLGVGWVQIHTQEAYVILAKDLPI